MDRIRASKVFRDKGLLAGASDSFIGSLRGPLPLQELVKSGSKCGMKEFIAVAKKTTTIV